MEFLKKIQNLPEAKRKLILWTIVVILALVLFVWWVQGVQKTLKSFRKEELRQHLQLPVLEEELKKLPKFEMPQFETPEISEKEWEELEKELSEEEREELRKFLEKQQSENGQ